MSAVESREKVDLRCPVGPKQLLGKTRVAAVVNSDNLIELACRDCAKNARNFDPTIRRIIHCFDFAGQLVESLTERGD